MQSALDQLLDLVSDLELPPPRCGALPGRQGVWMSLRTWAGGTIETCGATTEHAAAVLLELEFPGYMDHMTAA